MRAITAVSLLLSLCVLRASSQVSPYTFSPIVLQDSCPSEDAASQTTRANITSILYDLAAQISNESGLFAVHYAMCMQFSDARICYSISTALASWATLDAKRSFGAQECGSVLRCGAMEAR